MHSHPGKFWPSTACLIFIFSAANCDDDRGRELTDITGPGSGNKVPPATPAACGKIPAGGSETRVRYQAATVPAGGACTPEEQRRTCNDGQFSDWSGSYQAEACTVAGFVWPGPCDRALMSVNSEAGQANADSWRPAVSANGRFVVFHSTATNLVAGNAGPSDTAQVFLHDRQTHLTERISLTPAGQPGTGNSYAGQVSDDGRFVVFTSWASDLVVDDTNGTWDVFLRDRQTAITARVSVNSANEEADGPSENATLSGDGRFVAFESRANNLAPGLSPGRRAIYLRDRLEQTTTLVSVNSVAVPANDDSYQPSISADGRFVAFQSLASDLVADDTNGRPDIFLHDRENGTTIRVSVTSAGLEANNGSAKPNISADGRFVAFVSAANNLVPNDNNNVVDAFVYDRVAATVTRVSISTTGQQANNQSIDPKLSADGRFVSFTSAASTLVAKDNNDKADLFIHDRNSGTTQRVSSKENDDDLNGETWGGIVSGNGSFVLVATSARDLVQQDNSTFTDIAILPNPLAAATCNDAF